MKGKPMDNEFDPRPDASHESAVDARESEERPAVTRRNFLRGTTAVVLASSITVLAADCGGPNTPGLPPPPAIQDEYLNVPTTPNAPLTTTQLVFFAPHEAATIEALAARIIPGTSVDPGAREAGIVHYIDNLLGFNHGDDRATYRNGPFALAYEGDAPPSGLDLTKVVPVKKSELSRYSYQSTQTSDVEYHVGIQSLDKYTQAQYGKDFVDLTEQQQDGIVGDLADDKATGFDTPTARNFFMQVRQHTIEGFFCDPLYGGNQNMVGWKLVGYPGAQGGYTPREMQTEGSKRPYQSIAMLQYGGEPHPAPGVVLPVSGSKQR